MVRPTLVKDLARGPAGSSLEQFTAGRDRLSFIRRDIRTGGQELWRSEGTAGSTRLVRYLGSGSYAPQQLITLGDTLFFVAHQSDTGFELWRSDGTRRGTRLVRDIWPGAIGSQPASLAVLGERLYFSADDGSSGRELWSSDGTARGTRRVADLAPGFGGSGPSQLTAVGSTLFFAAGDIANQEGSSGVELWRSDGTAAGTRLVKDINPTGDAFGPRSSYPRDFTVLGSTLLFTAVDASSGRELWRSDGTAEGTQRVADLRPGLGIGSEPANLTPLGDRLLFTAFDADATPTLWLGDGTVASPRRLIPLTQAAGFTAVGDTAFFVNEDRAHGRELWRSDGSRRGTRLVQDLDPRQGYFGPFSADPTNLTAFGDSLLFTVAAVSGDGISQGQELWRSDGTPAGTVQVVDLWPGESGSAPERLTVVGTQLFFTADDGRRGRELWSLPLPAGPGHLSRAGGGARGPAPAAVAQPARRSRPGALRPQPLAPTRRRSLPDPGGPVRSMPIAAIRNASEPGAPPPDPGASGTAGSGAAGSGAGGADSGSSMASSGSAGPGGLVAGGSCLPASGIAGFDAAGFGAAADGLIRGAAPRPGDCQERGGAFARAVASPLPTAPGGDPCGSGPAALCPGQDQHVAAGCGPLLAPPGGPLLLPGQATAAAWPFPGCSDIP